MKKKIWDIYAPVYEKFMRADKKIYQMMYKRIPKVIKNKIVLEIATGPGLLGKNVAYAAKKIIATDYSDGMIKEAKKGKYAENLEFEKADATNLPYADKTFDAVIISNALHVMLNPEKALREIDRVLKDDGILIAPNFIHSGQGFTSKLWSHILKMAGIKFEHQWTKEEYIKFLSENGWKVVKQKEMPSRITMLYTECVRE